MFKGIPEIGITLDCEQMVPLSNNQADIEATERAFEFTFGWFMNPITFGDYPDSMKHLLRKRLPKFSSRNLSCWQEQDMPKLYVEGSFEMLGVVETGSDWLYIYPQGVHDLLLSIKEKYKDPIVYITENGISEHSSLTMDESLNDDQRVKSLNDHLCYLKRAMK
ncbi:isoflavonoid 7-O-beta-apiosyl-glucoside beta-glycosidase-like [Macadamia integrifolia]|uniref:isoflavonoid 7-O-beta-apiosyl-glucoside beta-glycosidase-like n=1 Tax=Macadamia integrifolia TaxID=60698 RepID=UPI001C4F8E62|nr:isoflavonoid 7-O-beta-apiosyl-glucoside beta-glycosidase-like [Macadamia integrifolia]